MCGGFTFWKEKPTSRQHFFANRWIFFEHTPLMGISFPPKNWCALQNCASYIQFVSNFHFLLNFEQAHPRFSSITAPCRWCSVPFCQRPYCDEHTRSHPNSEVKHRKARSVLGWGTAWEVLRVLLAFCARLLDSSVKIALESSSYNSTGLQCQNCTRVQ